MDDKLTYALNKDTVVIHFPKKYFVGSWGKMLELVRNKNVLGSHYIIIDLSNVETVDDCGLEFYFLRDEYKKNWGKGNIYCRYARFLPKDI